MCFLKPNWGEKDDEKNRHRHPPPKQKQPQPQPSPKPKPVPQPPPEPKLEQPSVFSSSRDDDVASLPGDSTASGMQSYDDAENIQRRDTVKEVRLMFRISTFSSWSDPVLHR